MSNAQSGAIYDAVLVDQITAPANQIIQTLGRLDAAFKQISQSAAPFAQQMQVIGAAMRQANRGPNEQALALGMVFNRVSEMSSQLGSSLGRAIEGLGNVMRSAGLAAVAMSGLMVAGIMDVIKVAGDATETLNAFNVVIDSTTNRGKDMIAWVDNFSTTLGRSNIQTKKAVTTYQSLWKGLGATGAQANKLTQTMVQLQADFGSFFNVTDDESLRRFIAALSGSSEVLDQFGINIRENALEAKAAELGFGDNVRKMTEYQKAITRAAILTDVLGKRIGALGDAARTQFEWANQVRILQASLLDLRIAFGNLIIAELKPYLNSINMAFRDLTARAKTLTSLDIKTFVNGILTLAGTGAGLVALGTAIAGVGSAITVAAIGFAGLMTSIGAMVAGGPIAAAVLAVTSLGVALTGLTLIDAARNFNWADAFDKLKQHATSAVESVSVGMDAVRKALAKADYATAWEALKLSGQAVFYELAKALTEIMGAAIKQVGISLLEMGQIVSNPGKALAAGINLGAGLKASLGGLDDKIAEVKLKLLDLRDSLKEPTTPPNVQGQKDAIENVKGLWAAINDEKNWQKLATAGDAFRDALKAAADEAKKIKQAANDWADSMLSPGEKFLRELQKIRTMAAINPGGRVTPEMVQRAQLEAAEKFMNEMPKPPKFQAQSVGTFSRNVAASAADFAPAFDPLLDENKKQTKQLDLIRQGVDKLDKGQATF